MGADDVFPHLGEVIQRVKNVRSLVRNLVVGVDVSITLYEGLHLHLLDFLVRQKTDGVIQHVVSSICGWVKLGCIPVSVFDGLPMPGKTRAHAARDKRRAKAQALLEAYIGTPMAEWPGLDLVALDTQLKAVLAGEAVATVLEDGVEVRKPLPKSLLGSVVKPDEDLVLACMAAIVDLGLQVYRAPREADAQLAMLDRLDIVQFVYSTDADMLCLGVRRLLREVDGPTNTAQLVSWTSMVAKKTAEDVPVQSPLCKLLRRYNNPAILALRAAIGGCDYGKVGGIGPDTATTLLLKLKKQVSKKAQGNTITTAEVCDALAQHMPKADVATQEAWVTELEVVRPRHRHEHTRARAVSVLCLCCNVSVLC